MPDRFAAIPPVWHGTLAERTRQGLAALRAEGSRGSYAFDDAGDGTTYAEWFADLLTEWVAQRDRCYAALGGQPPAQWELDYLEDQAAGRDPLERYAEVGEPCPQDPGARHVG